MTGFEKLSFRHVPVSDADGDRPVDPDLGLLVLGVVLPCRKTPANSFSLSLVLASGKPLRRWQANFGRGPIRVLVGDMLGRARRRVGSLVSS